MPFAYYERLSRAEQAVYRVSDRVTTIPLPDAESLWPLVGRLREKLPGGDLDAIAAEAARICGGISRGVGVPPVAVQVLEIRPHDEAAELHGLYTRSDDHPPMIRVWMRTARKQRVVAFKTFLRTLLHEICHHLDLELLGLPLSLHTEGFFKRESSLFHQLVPDAPRRPRAPPTVH